MKRIILISVFALALLGVAAITTLRTWMEQSVKSNIELAKAQYPGRAEDALIAFLSDTNQTTHDRIHKAIWTLGQIRSKKALPLLKELYKGDPKGETCFGKHDSLLCQYEIYKAIQAIEKRQFFSFQKLNN